MEMSNNTICRHAMTSINFYIVYIQTNVSPLIFMQSHLQYLLDFTKIIHRLPLKNKNYRRDLVEIPPHRHGK